MATVAAVATIPGAVIEATAGVPFHPLPTAHFALVVAAASAAAIASVVLSVAGARVGDGRTVLLGAAFSTMTALLAVHGLATPGVLAGENGVVRFAGAASLPAGAFVLALTALPALRRPEAVGGLLAAQATAGFLILASGASALWWPSLIPPLPETGSAAAWAVLTIGCALLALIGRRAVLTWQLTRRTTDLLTVAGVAWLAIALIAQMTIPAGTAGYYLGHVVQLGGVLAIALPAVLDLRGRTSSGPLVGYLSGTDLIRREEAFLGVRVRALLMRLAEKDAATEGHARRVALLAVRLGESMGVPPARLRALALGALLHDIGKLSVRTEVLQKPGALDDEFAEIRKHPEAGLRLLEEQGGFGPSVLSLVHDHHERLDGSGYPRGLAAADLALETRILAVCDVYDALVSDRVYRAAWAPERALALLRDEAGTRMDGACVAALERLVAPPFVAGLAAPAAPARRPPVTAGVRPVASGR